jgi:hypothetical protein
MASDEPEAAGRAVPLCSAEIRTSGIITRFMCDEGESCGGGRANQNLARSIAGDVGSQTSVTRT